MPCRRVYIGMTVKLSKYLLKTLVPLCGRRVELWEATLSYACGFDIELPRFFWEVEVFLLHAERPKQMTLLCAPPRDFVGLEPGREYLQRLRRHVMSSIYRQVSWYHNNGAATNGNGHTLLWLPSRNGGFVGWESVQ